MPPPKGAYLLTEDLGEKIKSFRHQKKAIEIPDLRSSFYRDIQDDLAAAIQRAIGADYSVVQLRMTDLSDEIIGKIAQVYDNDVFIVSTCPEITYPSNGATVEINRLVDTEGNALGLGPRPGHPALQQQFNRIAFESRGKEVVIAEDGMFEGNTMSHVVRGLQQAGANVVGVVVGFSYNKSPIDLIQNDIGVKVDVVQDFGPMLDWVPDHDFLPFTPGCGKPIGVKVGQGLYPFYNHQHATFCVPYIRPFGPAEWTGIPEDKMQSFSLDCMRLARGLFTEIDSLNEKPVLISDILYSRQRVGIPLSLSTESQSLPSKDSQVITFLAECD